jgi:hypothetical protein
MKLYFIAVILSLSCVVAGFMENDTCIQDWGISTTYRNKEKVLHVKACSETKLNLADSIYIEKSVFDDSLIGYGEQHFSVSDADFIVDTSKKIVFLNKAINVYKIWWMKESSGYMDYSSYVIYTKEYGIVYKLFPKRWKDYHRWRLINLKYPNSEMLSFNEFTNGLLQDTVLFPPPCDSCVLRAYRRESEKYGTLQ